MTSGASIDGDRNPVPWFTYPAIDYLSQFDYSDKSVFEFGAGNSTRFWGERSQSVTAVEHDFDWYTRIGAELGPSARLLFANSEWDYANAIVATGDMFDVIVVDGWYRKACISPTLERLNHGGMVILDNSDWLPETAEMLRSADLIQVDFSGFGPICPWRWTTSVFLTRAFAFAARPPKLPHPPPGGSPPPDSARGM